MSTSICKYARDVRSKICSTYQVKPIFCYCTSQNSRYYGYKLHVVCDKNDVFHSFDLAGAYIHDVNYLKDVKYNLKNYTLIAYEG